MKKFALGLISLAALALFIAACGSETEVVREVKVPGETIIVEKEVIKEVQVPGETITVEKEVIKEVKVPGETVVVKEVVIQEVPVQVIVEKEVIKEVKVPGETVTVVREVVKEVPVERIVEMVKEVDPRYGGSLKWAGNDFVKNFQPNHGQRETITGLHNAIFDTLMAWDPEMNVSPQMAESFEVLNGGKRYRLTLRDDLMFHNGDSVTTDDVVASLLRWTEDDGFALRFITPMLEGSGISAIDDKTIEISLNQVNGQILAQIGKNMQYVPGIMPADIARIPIATKLTREQMIGSGPAIFAEWREQERSVLERFEDYVPRQEPGRGTAGGKRMFFDTITQIAIPERPVRVAALQTGEIDLAKDVPVQNIQRLEDDVDIITKFGKPALQIVFQVNKTDGIFGNTPEGAMMRQAVFVGLDPVDHLLAFTGGTPVWKLCPTMFSCEVWWGGKEVVPGLYNARDTARAKQMVKDSGYNNETVIISAPPGGDPRTIAGMELVVFKLKERLGLNAVIDFIPNEIHGPLVVTKCKDRKDLAGTEWVPKTEGGTGEPQKWHLGGGASSTWHMRVFASQWLDKWDWRGCWDNQAFQDLKLELLAETDKEKQRAIFDNMQRVFMADPSFIFHGEVPVLHGYDKDLAGYQQVTLAGIMLVGMWWDNAARR